MSLSYNIINIHRVSIMKWLLVLSPPPPPALQSLKDLGRLTYRRFLKLREMVGLLGRVISPPQGLSTFTGQHNTERRGQTSMP
jgi:hypothetical protein